MGLYWQRYRMSGALGGELCSTAGNLVLTFYPYGQSADESQTIQLGRYDRNVCRHMGNLRLENGRYKSAIEWIEDKGGWSASLSHDILGEETSRVFDSPHLAQEWVETECRAWLARTSESKIR